ncbi:DUF58 domain-containing protein [Kibdelosporangium persicum]|uniref:Erythromycin resistance leader peptide n=1 Tax=Kibdelosporangium persicum TaxID=2698649 RepID=A0ABX2F1T5_9PSEU|nr:DUF58 domain-containing protein [Kibdelosporangium persicum]NRN64955.1 Erythromycin resistance leader peptide [Kibdelosporangium persicum]
MTSVSDLVPDRRIRQLELTITRRLDGLLRGEYAGLLPGQGSELAGSREYRPGEDEVRRIDWAVTARTDMPHVRETVAEHELTTQLLVDATPSMDFGTVELEKRELAVAAVAAVGFLTAGAGNRLGAGILTGDGVRRYPARAGRAHLIGLLRKLLAQPRGQEGQQAALADAIRALHTALRRRALVVIVSDFLDDSDWPREIRRLATRHQVIAIEVTDPRELELPDVGLLTVVDPETGRKREIATGSRRLRERYAAAASEQRLAVRRGLRSAGAAHVPLSTGRDWVADIVRHVHAQRRLALGGKR